MVSCVAPMSLRRRSRIAGLLLGLVVLAGCESAEERAAGHFRAAEALLAAGDTPRAMVELRNVFKLDGGNLAARLTYARLLRETGSLRPAYSQYLLVAEQAPDNLEARRALAELALLAGDWAEVARHGAAAAALAPDDPLVRAITTAAGYRDALERRDTAAGSAAVDTARALIDALPDVPYPRQVVIDDALRRADLPGALAAVDAALAVMPDEQSFYPLRLGILNRMNDAAAVEAQLKDMAVRFPGDPTVEPALLRWYLARGETDKAEAHLRAGVAKAAAAAAGTTPGTAASGATDTAGPAAAAPDPGAAPLPAPLPALTQARMALVRFLAEQRGIAAARTELDAVILAAPADRAIFSALRAGLDFEAGDPAAGIAGMRAILQDAAAPGPTAGGDSGGGDSGGGASGGAASEETHAIRIALARMLATTGDLAAARTEVDRVLAEDPSQVEALKLRAEWLIGEDRTGDAMIALRLALDQSPRDAGVMTLIARAHERDGNRDLMAEMLALAVEASNRAPAETLRYAGLLIEEQKFLAAEEALINALRLAPQDPAILRMLGTVYLAMADWARAEQVVAQLRRLAAPQAGSDSGSGAGAPAVTQVADQAGRLANDLTARLLSAQRRDSELVSFLQGLVASGQAGLGAEAAILRSHIANNDPRAALDYARTLLARDPQNPELRFLHATALAVAGDAAGSGTVAGDGAAGNGGGGAEAEAEAIFRDLVAEDGSREAVWQALYSLLAARGDDAGAAAVLTAGLAAQPGSVTLRWIRASALQAAGDIPGAIAVYDALLAENTDSAVFANNLASLLSTHYDDPANLDRAQQAARRLRGSNVPAFQDTYGWIALRRGNPDEALTYLEPAARDLPDDASVQYHLGKAYAALGRPVEALTQLRKALVLVEAADPQAPPPGYGPDLMAEIARLETEPGAGPGVVPEPGAPPVVPAASGN